VTENAMNNPAISKKYKSESDKEKSITLLPSKELVRSFNPSTRTKMDLDLDLDQKEDLKVSKDDHFRAKTPRQSEEIIKLNPDFDILNSALDLLFTSTYMYDDRTLTEFLQGLGKLTINMLEDNSPSKKVIPIKKKDTAIFGIVRILEVALVNMKRIDLIWDTVFINELALISS
jgi:hypothetical protein